LSFWGVDRGEVTNGGVRRRWGGDLTEISHPARVVGHSSEAWVQGSPHPGDPIFRFALTSLSSLALLGTAVAAPPHGNAPGLQRVCESVAPEPTVDESLATLREAATNPPECDMTLERGICLFGGSAMLATDGGTFGVVPVDRGAVGDLGGEDPVYEATLLLDHIDDNATYAVFLNGELLAEGPTSDGEVRIEGRVAPPRSTRLWTHVAVTHRGGRLEQPTYFPPQEDDSTPRALLAGGKSWSNGGPVVRFEYDIGARLGDDGVETVRVRAVIDVVYANAGQ
jgi:hypothetical protein